MNLTWTRYQTTPTITTVETNNYPIWNVDFPAITICNNNKVDATAARNFSQILVRNGIDEKEARIFLSHLAKLIQPDFLIQNFTEIHEVLINMNYTIEKLMFELMVPCGQMMEICIWLGEVIPCDDLFRVITSTEGFCCAFNYRPPLDEESVDIHDDYVEDTEDNFSYNVWGAGQHVGLELLIQMSKQNYVSYTRSMYGVAVLIHNSKHFPKNVHRVVIAQPSYDVQIAIVPSIVESVSNVRTLPLIQRNCYFDDEVKLLTTDKYTYSSCISECSVRTIFRLCKCVPFYYPELHLRKYLGTIRQCTLEDVNCTRANQDIIYSLQPKNVEQMVGMTCEKCLPSCSDITYNAQVILARRNTRDKLTVSYDFNLTNYVTLKAYFKDISCIKYRRDVLMTWDSLFASFGGIFGLCLGCSIISLIELIYYFTIKLIEFCTDFKNDQHNGNDKFKIINVKTISN